MLAPEPIDYVARWQALVDARRDQMEAAFAETGRSGGDFWRHRASQFREFSRRDRGDDPLIRRLLADLPPGAIAVDVGAGTGRHAVPLAAHIARVVAVEPSPAMLRFLREEIADAGLVNVEVIEGAWPEVDVPLADAVYSSHVLYPVREIVPFLHKMDGCARDRCYLYLRAERASMDFGLWAEFHGEPLVPQPSAIDAFNVLWQIGIHADLQVVQAPLAFSFPSLDEAVEQMAHTVAIAPGDDRGRERLRAILRERLVPEGGRLAFPARVVRSAIISWRPGSAAAA